MPSRRPARATVVNLTNLAAACGDFTDEVIDVALPAIGARMKAIALEQAERATGGDRKLSRFAKGRGIRLNAGYDKTGPATITLTPRPIGPWTLVESGSTRSTWYIPRTPKRRRRGPRTTRRLRLRNGGVRWYVKHGPVRGKQVWTRTRRQIDEELPDLVHDAALDAWATVRRAA